MPTSKPRTAAHAGSASTAMHRQAPGRPEVAGVTITHPDRILYSEQGVTKLDIARYYQDVEDWILPHLADRPLSLLRCPEGPGEACFFQKHPSATFARELPRVAIKEKEGGTADYLYVSTLGDLITLAQFGVLEIHVWGGPVANVDAPDTLVFDLDPGPGVSWNQIVEAAFGVRDRLEALGLTGFPQATGGKGVHVVVPIEPTLTWDQARDFVRAICRAQASDHPESFTTNMAKARREGRIFLDYLRNGRGNTSIARYSLRAREGAPVATPLRWEELAPLARANRYGLGNIRRRLAALKSDPWAGYEQARTRVGKDKRTRAGSE